jgi:lipid A 3-O-deacylase
MKFRFIAALAALLSVSELTSAQSHAHEFGFQSDNDSFLAQGSDRYYTNGLFIFYRQALSTTGNTKLANKVLGLEVGQKMFNPISGSVPNASFVDRPFAAYLYAGANLNLLYKNESNLKLSAQTGMIGPAALGKQVQNIIHDTFGFYTLNGWQYQIRNNFQLNLSAEYNRLLARTSWIDISASAYGNIGTGFNGAGVGPLVRIGDFNQLFNSVSTQSTSTRNATTPLHNRELFAYYKPQFNYVAYDATVEGGLFQDNQPGGPEIRSTPNRAVLSQQVGVAYGGKRWIIDLAAVFHTRDVKTQTFSTHQWGSATVLYRFN